MLKTIALRLSGRDSAPLELTELPALVADRHARAVLTRIGVSPDGGVIALAFEHMNTVRALGPESLDLLAPFVQASRPIRDWRNLMPVQQAAMALHAGFLVGRPQLEIPVAMQGQQILRSDADLAVHFCSPALAGVLHSGRATYRELETVLSTEDVYNLTELLNVEAVRDWRAHQSRSPHP